jgi:hypothetical protein
VTVPDGVATVTRTAGASSATARVRNNAFQLRFSSDRTERATLTWRDQEGRAIKTVSGL